MRPGPWGRSAAKLPFGLVLLAFGSAALPSPDPLSAQTVVRSPIGREAAMALEYPPLAFTPPEPGLHTVRGVEVFHLHDPTFPLVDVFVRVKGGSGLFGREAYAPFSALPALLRSGGTRTLPPDSVEARIEGLALQLSFGGGGASQSSSMNALASNLPASLELWNELLLEPGFDSLQVEVWRGQEIESSRRRRDDPGTLAYSEFNRLLFGDHPVGWELEEGDLSRERFGREALLRAHARIWCRDRLTIGISGDAPWDTIRPLLERMLERWPPCTEEIPEAPQPTIRDEPGVWLIPRKIDQSTVVLAHPVPLRQDDSRDYVTSRIAVQILGGGGFSSRLMSRVRSELGYAYSVSSLWTTPERYDGLVGATTRSGPGTTIAAIGAILEEIERMRVEEPSPAEVNDAIEALVNGFAFNFDSPAQVVVRRMAYRAQGLPDDWLEQYAREVQTVTPGEIRDVVRKYVDPTRMMILIVGDPDGFDAPLDPLGPVRILEPRARIGPDRGPAPDANGPGN